ncbi:MAG: hypothetical protein GY716_04945 [bacterium]|nr:hypothetical protein [bacterium]
MRGLRIVGWLGLGFALFAACTAVPVQAEDTYWHIKGVHPKGYLLDVKAVGAEGKLYDVKGIQRDDNVHMLDVKAFVDGEIKPVKVVVADERYGPVMAIDVAGNNLPLKAITPDGKQLDVKAVRRTGSILHIKVVGIGGRFFGVKAISEDGRLYDVKGIKMLKERAEMLIGTVKIHAHVKGLPPAGDAEFE